MNHLIIDDTPTSFKEYKFSPVRLTLQSTGEVFNIGVIVEDEKHTKELRLIDSFSSLSKCLKLTDYRSLDFVLDYLRENIDDIQLTKKVSISNAVIVDTSEWMNTEKDISDAATEIFEELVTIAHGKGKHTSFGEHTSNSIVTKVKKMAESKGYNHISFRKHVKEAFNKQIDTVTENENGQPVVLGEVCSPIVQSFHHDVAFSIMALEMALAGKIVHSCILYIPFFSSLKGSALDNYRYAKETAIKKNIHIVDSKDYGEFLGEIAETSKRAGAPLI